MRPIIRHYWSGPVKCESPNYGQWGGPPDGNAPQPIAARGLAMVARGKMAPPKVIRSPVPTLGIPGQPPPRHGK